MTRSVVISAILFAATLGLGGAPAHAHTPRVVVPERSASVDHARPAPVLWAQSRVSARQAKTIALREVPGGEVVDISRDGNVYRVRVVARSGRVVDVLVDATTGRVVG